MKLATSACAAAMAAAVRLPTLSSVLSQSGSSGCCDTLRTWSAPRPESAMPEMTFQSAMDVVTIPGLRVSSWVNTVGHLRYVHGVKTLLITPVFSPQAPVRIEDHDGFEMVVCPTIDDAAVVLS